MDLALSSHQPVRVIQPERRFWSLDLAELWEYRELLLFLAWRDIKVRYKQSLLGASWALLQPLLAMVIFTIFFGRLAKVPSDGIPYPLFVYAGLVPWTFFANTVSTSGLSFVSNNNLITKVYFPRLIVPVSTVGAMMVDFAIASLLLIGMMIYYGVAPGASVAVLPLALALLVLTAIGVGTLLAALTVWYRDFRYVVPFLMQIWMFGTPVVYPASLVPAKWRWTLALNPMAGIIDAFKASVLGRPVDLESLGISAAVATVICVVALLYFQRVERRLVDVI